MSFYINQVIFSSSSPFSNSILYQKLRANELILEIVYNLNCIWETIWSILTSSAIIHGPKAPYIQKRLPPAFQSKIVVTMSIDVVCMIVHTDVALKSALFPPNYSMANIWNCLLCLSRIRVQINSSLVVNAPYLGNGKSSVIGLTAQFYAWMVSWLVTLFGTRDSCYLGSMTLNIRL